jgi:predicted esterase
MTNQPLHSLEAEEQRYRQAEGLLTASLYADLCALEKLQQAYAHVQENARALSIDPPAIETIEANGVKAFLKQLSDDLQARTYHPSPVADHEGQVAIRDLVVQVTLKRLLESAFPPAFPSDSEPEKTIKWLAGNIDKGLYRIYAVNLNENLDDGVHDQLLERASRRIGDPQLIGLLKEVLAVSPSPQGLLTPLLADIAFEGIDHILQQAKALGREDNFLHVQCTRVGNELIVLSDRDPRYDWILPAVQNRLREELSNLGFEPAAVETQSFDLTSGVPLRFLGFDLRWVQRKHGESRVEYRLVEETDRRQGESTPAPRRSFGRYHPLRFVQPCVSWIGRQQIWQIVQGAYRKTNAVQVGWRHLPITLSPIMALLFGWRSPATWLCLAAIFVCNWRWTLAIVRTVGTWARRHKLDVAMGAGALVFLACLYPVASEIYANLSREETVPFMAPGFYRGQYNKDSPWGAELVPYGLYVPPHSQKEKGPFPLIVYLHGYGERTKAKLFKAGLPLSIAKAFGPNKPNGPFEFIAFFPIDPTGKWETGSFEVEDAMRALDYVIGRHRIDPARVYLTGISNGGMGVWRLAEAYPDRWAAVVPVSSFISPDVSKVRHISAWIFHAAKDKQAPVKRERDLVKQLKEANADVRYTEIPNKGHEIWREAYDAKELYDWLATKKKD